MLLVDLQQADVADPLSDSAEVPCVRALGPCITSGILFRMRLTPIPGPGIRLTHARPWAPFRLSSRFHRTSVPPLPLLRRLLRPNCVAALCSFSTVPMKV